MAGIEQGIAKAAEAAAAVANGEFNLTPDIGAITAAALAAYFFNGFYYLVIMDRWVYWAYPGTTKKTLREGPVLMMTTVYSIVCWWLAAFVFYHVWYCVDTDFASLEAALKTAGIYALFSAVVSIPHYSWGDRAPPLFLYEAVGDTLQTLFAAATMWFWINRN